MLRYLQHQGDNLSDGRNAKDELPTICMSNVCRADSQLASHAYSYG